MDVNKLWCEKYRPKTLDELILNEDTKNILRSYKETKDIPHLLFVSTPGKGKTSVARIIVNDILKCDYLYINASDENGIDTIRFKIVNFAQTKSFDGGLKVIILDECDALSESAARALRNIMEEYSNTTRFILTANYKHKIIPAIQSRCQTLEFNQSLTEVIQHCASILQKEKIKITTGEQITKLKNLIKNNFPDIRKTLNELQKYSLNGILDIKNYSLPTEFVSDIFEKIKTEDVSDVRKHVIASEAIFQSDYHNLLKCLLNYIYDSDLDSLKKKECILIITEHMYRHTFVIDIEINSFACFITLSKILNQQGS